MVRKFLDLTDKDLQQNPYVYDEEQLLYTLRHAAGCDKYTKI
jgi:hypothetical protein